MIVVNNETFRVACQGILMKTIYLLSNMPLLFKMLFAVPGFRDQGSGLRGQGSTPVKFATLVFFEKFNGV